MEWFTRTYRVSFHASVCLPVGKNKSACCVAVVCGAGRSCRRYVPLVHIYIQGYTNIDYARKHRRPSPAHCCALLQQQQYSATLSNLSTLPSFPYGPAESVSDQEIEGSRGRGKHLLRNFLKLIFCKLCVIP